MERPRTIYISGPITGHEETAPEAFRRAADALACVPFAGIVNPCAAVPPGTPYHEAMRRAFRLLIDCDAVALLDGWHGSRGCMAELAVASAIGLPVKPLSQWLEGVEWMADE